MNAREKFRRWLGPEPEGRLLAFSTIPVFLLALIFGSQPAWGPWVAAALLASWAFLALFSADQQRRREGPPRPVRAPWRVQIRARPWAAAVQLLALVLWITWAGFNLALWASSSERLASSSWLLGVYGLMAAKWAVDWLYDQRNLRRGLDAKADLSPS